MDLEAYPVSNYMSKSKDYVYIYVFMCTFYLKTGDFFIGFKIIVRERL